MRIVAGFHTRNDEWVLPYKLATLSTFCDAIVVVLDRPSDETWAIVKQFPRAHPYVYENVMGLPDEGPDGLICEEGRLRQLTWDRMADLEPTWCALGDTDEIHTPDVVDVLNADPDADLLYLDTVNLYKTPLHYISGPRCVWSPQHPRSNKKGALVRFDPSRHRAGGYRYDLAGTRHVRIEPSPTRRHTHTVTDRQQHVAAPRLIHWKWVQWDRWLLSKQAQLTKYQRMWDGLELSTVPREWHWPNLPDNVQPIAPR